MVISSPSFVCKGCYTESLCEGISWSGHARVLPGYVPYVPHSQGMAHILEIPRRGMTRICLWFCSVHDSFRACWENLPNGFTNHDIRKLDHSWCTARNSGWIIPSEPTPGITCICPASRSTSELHELYYVATNFWSKFFHLLDGLCFSSFFLVFRLGENAKQPRVCENFQHKRRSDWWRCCRGSSRLRCVGRCHCSQKEEERYENNVLASPWAFVFKRKSNRTERMKGKENRRWSFGTLGEITLTFATCGAAHHWRAGPEVALETLKNGESLLIEMWSNCFFFPPWLREWLMFSVHASVSF